MSIDPVLVAGALVVGVVVGLTGMGGGALMTPMLVLFFNVPPTAAVSSDLVASAVMKPVGAAVHLRKGTVDVRLVGWLCAGSIPAAFAGVLVGRLLGEGQQVQTVIRYALGCALLLAAGGLAARAYVRLVERAAIRDGKIVEADQTDVPRVEIRRVPTVVVGAVGGLVVGMTSVGSGSLMIVALLVLYPALRANQLVGTDLTQAVPLVGAAALGHLLLGDFRLDLTLGLLLGSIPGVWIGAQLSSRLSGRIVRRALVFVLFASALKLFEVGNLETLLILAASTVTGPVAWMMLRRLHGFPLTYGAERRARLRGPAADAGRTTAGGRPRSH